MSSNPHVSQPELIQFVGLKDLSIEEQDVVTALSAEYYEKIKRLVTDLTNISVNVKFYQKEGAKKKYAFHVKAVVPGHIFESCNQDSWELPKAVHMSFDSLLHQINHKLHIDTTRPN